MTKLTCVAKARDIEHTLLQSSRQNAADQHLKLFRQNVDTV